MRNLFLSASGWSERGADDYVPFVGHIRDNAVLRTDGSVMGMLRLVGAPFALEDHGRRNGRYRFRNAVLRNIADDTLTVVETMVRHDGTTARRRGRAGATVAPSPPIWMPPTGSTSSPDASGSTSGSSR